MFLEISQNSQEGMCARVSFFNKVAAFRPINSIIKYYCSCCIIMIRIDTILSRISTIIFKICFSRSCLPSWPTKQDTFWKFYSPADTLWSSKNFRWVLGYTTVLTSKMSHDWVQYVLFARQMKTKCRKN